MIASAVLGVDVALCELADCCLGNGGGGACDCCCCRVCHALGFTLALTVDEGSLAMGADCGDTCVQSSIGEAEDVSCADDGACVAGLYVVEMVLAVAAVWSVAGSTCVAVS